MDHRHMVTILQLVPKLVAITRTWLCRMEAFAVVETAFPPKLSILLLTIQNVVVFVLVTMA
jgi:hypothetical protein